MKVFEKLLINEIEKKIPYQSHPKAKYWNKKISEIEKGIKTKISDTIIKQALENSKSKVTSKKLKEYKKVNIEIEKVKKFVNKINLRVFYLTDNNTVKTVEIMLTKSKYPYNTLYDKAIKTMDNLNIRNRQKYDGEKIIGIEEFYLVERKIKK